MVVNYFGDGCFRIQSGDISVLIDSASKKLKSDVLIKTLIPSNPEIVGREINMPGEYEVRGILINGFEVVDESTNKFIKIVYVADWNDVKFLFLGHISKFPNPDLLEKLDKPDVVIIPVGTHFLEDTDAVKLLKQLDPQIIIPSFCKKGEEFAKAVGYKAEKTRKFAFKKKDVFGGEKKIVLLEKD